MISEDFGEMTAKDYKKAKADIDEILEKIGATSGDDLLEILHKAKKIDAGTTEVNGDTLAKIDDNGRIWVNTRGYNVDQVEWIRIESYDNKYMYIYLPVDASGKISVRDISFDIYPNPDTDDCWENVHYRDCLKYVSESRKMRWRRI